MRHSGSYRLLEVIELVETLGRIASSSAQQGLSPAEQREVVRRLDRVLECFCRCPTSQPGEVLRALTEAVHTLESPDRKAWLASVLSHYAYSSHELRLSDKLMVQALNAAEKVSDGFAKAKRLLQVVDLLADTNAGPCLQDAVSRALEQRTHVKSRTEWLFITLRSARVLARLGAPRTGLGQLEASLGLSEARPAGRNGARPNGYVDPTAGIQAPVRSARRRY